MRATTVFNTLLDLEGVVVTGVGGGGRVTVREQVSAIAEDHGPSVKDDEQCQKLRE